MPLDVDCQPPRRKRTMGMKYPEVRIFKSAPYKRVEFGIAVSIGFAIMDRQREIAHDGAIGFILHRIPRCHHTWSPTPFLKPMDIVLDSEGDSVKNRRETIVEDAVEAFFPRM